MIFPKLQIRWHPHIVEPWFQLKAPVSYWVELYDETNKCLLDRQLVRNGLEFNKFQEEIQEILG
jgi:hypothetical protein